MHMQDTVCSSALLRMTKQVRRKLVVMTGDLGLPALGLTAQDRATLCREVHYVIHSAASISFVDHIHRLLAHNYTVRAALRFPTVLH